MKLTHDFVLPGGYIRPDLDQYLHLLWYRARVPTSVLVQAHEDRRITMVAEGLPDSSCSVKTVRNSDVAEYIVKSTGEGEYLEFGIKIIWKGTKNTGGIYPLSSYELCLPSRPPIFIAGPPAAMIAGCSACGIRRRPVVATRWNGIRSEETIVRLGSDGPIVFEYAARDSVAWSTDCEMYCAG